jgi:hypothetical protein
MLSAIVQKRTGQTVLEYLRPRLFDPLGITGPSWATNRQGISLGGYGLRVRTEDIAKFGQLYLQKGKWQGRQLIYSEWIESATSRQATNGSNPKSDWEQGYGFQFWRCRHRAYRGDGAFGQFCVILPEQDAVIAITSGLKDMQAVLDIIWDQLLPAFQKRRLQPDHEKQGQLARKLASLKVRPASGTSSSPWAVKVLNRKYVFPSNEEKLESITLTQTEDRNGLTAILQSKGSESRFPCGFQEWKRSRGAFGSYEDEPVAGTMAWKADDTVILKLCAYETPYYQTLTLRFAGDEVFFDSSTNVSLRAAKELHLTGRAQ